MALFTDALISAEEDLTAHDSQLFEVASTENIDVGRKLALAQEELSVELTALLNRAGAVLQRGSITEPNCGHVVVTPALKLWHTYRTLEMVYRDAYHNQLNDRYAGKRDSFRDMARWGREKLIELGIGVVGSPMPRADAPQLTAAQGHLPYGSYYATMSWVNHLGQEGASATPAVIYLEGTGLTAIPSKPPLNANGWNVYVGTSPEMMSRQNASVLAPVAVWTQSGPLNVGGPLPCAGQAPDSYVQMPRIIQRG